MGNIQRLDEHLMNMISAGEVVERPSGIVKELIENSIDAKATSIDVVIKEGGISYIQVKDNGIGMDATDATMAFERHATSKLKSEKDLFSIKTMGFRGEALPSIASVSKVRLLTNNGIESSLVEIDNGKLLSAKPFSTSEGTEITIENLFIKTPARLKHLKTKQYETSMVSSIIEKYALGHPEISFSLVSDDKELLNFNGNGNLSEVIMKLYGTDAAKQTINFEKSDYDFKVSGALVRPNITRASSNYITLFINHRLIRHYRIQKVILEAFSDYLFNDRYPIVVLNIDSDPQLVDVNVHPTKWEVRLSKSQQLEDLIRTTIYNTLKQNMAAPEVAYIEKPKEKFEYTSLIFDEAKPVENEKYIVKEEKEIITLPKKEEIKEEVTISKNPNLFPLMSIIGQLHGRYILAEAEDGLYFIDQHAAQERYNYERFQKMLVEKKVDYQPLLIPFVCEVGASIVNDFDNLALMFKDVQLEIEQFGTDSILCREIPVWMNDVDLNVYFQDLIDLYKNDQKPDLLTLRDHALESLACHASVKFNTYLSMDEMKEIVIHLKQCANPYKCPHGRPTFILLSETKLKKEFLR